MRQLRRWKRLWKRSLTCSDKRTSMGPYRSCWNGTTSALQPEEITSKGTRVSWVFIRKKCSYEKRSGNLFNDSPILLFSFIQPSAKRNIRYSVNFYQSIPSRLVTLKEPNAQPVLLFTDSSGWGTNKSMPYTRWLAWKKTWIRLSNNWTWVADSIYFDINSYAKPATDNFVSKFEYFNIEIILRCFSRIKGVERKKN